MRGVAEGFGGVAKAAASGFNLAIVSQLTLPGSARTNLIASDGDGLEEGLKRSPWENHNFWK